jgi:photosystem II stability/assembly factor-like uncharacterized protein
MFRTQDGGKTWTPVRPQAVNWDGQFSFIDMLKAWAVARDSGQIALVKTSNGGVTWTDIQPVVTP